MKLKAGLARCCVKGTGEKSVTSPACSLRWSDNQSVAAFASSAALPTRRCFSVSARVAPRGGAPLQKGEDRGELRAVGAAAAAHPGGHGQQEAVGRSPGQPQRGAGGNSPPTFLSDFRVQMFVSMSVCDYRQVSDQI